MREIRRRRGFLALVVLTFGLGVVGSVPTVRAQEAPDTSAADVFGGFTSSARSNGVQVTYDSPGTFPFSPVIQMSIPEALATLTTGPSGYAQASLAYPGQLLGNLPAIMAQTGNEPPPFLGPYPVQATASFPAGPFRQDQNQGPVTQQATAEGLSSNARTVYTGLTAPPIISAGSVTSTSQSAIEDGIVVSRTRTVLSDVSLLAGLVTIESVVTDLIATTDAEAAASDGGTQVNGLRVLGLAATVDGDGMHLAEAPPVADDPSGGPLGSLVPGLEPVAGGLNDLLEPLGGATDEAFAALMEQSGIDIRLLQPTASGEGAAVERVASGLVIEIDYDGTSTPVFSDLLALVPADQLPSESPEGAPINASPQALVNLMKETHITSFALAPGATSVDATPAFEFEVADPGFGGGAGDLPLDTGSFTSPDLGSGGDFATGTPSLGGPGGAGGGPALSGEPILSVGEALPAAALIILTLSAPWFAMGSSRLADNTLSAASSSCPEGRDRPEGADAP